jgi:hypothetical protein
MYQQYVSPLPLNRSHRGEEADVRRNYGEGQSATTKLDARRGGSLTFSAFLTRRKTLEYRL